MDETEKRRRYILKKLIVMLAALLLSGVLFAKDAGINKKDYTEYTVLDFYYTDFHEGDKVFLKDLVIYDTSYPGIYCKDSSTDDWIMVTTDEEKYYDLRENAGKKIRVYGSVKRNRKFNREVVEIELYEYQD